MDWMILPLRKYAVFTGRSRRKEFWLYVLFTVVASIVLSLLDTVLGLGGSVAAGPRPGMPAGASGFGYGAGVRGGVLANVFALATLIPNITVAVRRLHDTDRSGWWVLVPVVPLFVGVFCLVGGFITGGVGSLMLIGGIALLAAAVCAIVLLVWYCTNGTIGPNRYGEDPKGGVPSDLRRTFE